MFNTDYTPRSQRGPSRPGTPNNRARPSLKAEPSTSQSSSSGWGWPRLVSVEVDIEEKRRKESHDSLQKPKAEHAGKEPNPKQDLPSDSFEHAHVPRGGMASPEKPIAQSKEHDPASSVEQQPKDIPLPPSPEDPARPLEQRPGSQDPSPSAVDCQGSHRAHETITADEFPMPESSHSPTVSNRRTNTGYPTSRNTIQQPEVQEGDPTAMPDGEFPPTNPEGKTSDYVNKGRPSKEVSPPPKANETQPEFTKTTKLTKRSSGLEPKADKRMSGFAHEGTPPGSFPGAGNMFNEEQSSQEEESSQSEVSATPTAPKAGESTKPRFNHDSNHEPVLANNSGSPNKPSFESKSPNGDLPREKATKEDSSEPLTKQKPTENESSKAHVKFRGDDYSPPSTDVGGASTLLPEEKVVDESSKGRGGQSADKPSSCSRPYQSGISSSTPETVKTEAIRRPSRDSLRTRSRKPSVYIPLFKVAEAKGKIESGNVQQPQSGVIVNVEEVLSPADSEHPEPREEKGFDLSRPKTFTTEPTSQDYGELLHNPQSTHSPGSYKQSEPSLPSSQAVVAENISSPEQISRRESSNGEGSTTTPSPPSEASQSPPLSRRGSVVRKKPTPEDVMKRISIPNEQLYPESSSKSRKSSRRSTKMSLPPPKIFIQSPSSASDLPEPVPTPAAPVSADEYRIKTRSGTIISVEHTVQKATDKLSQSPVKKRKLYLRKARNLAARRVILNATLGRQMGGRTKERLRQLAKGENPPVSPVVAQENAPDLPPLRNRKSFIRKARNVAARKAFLDATLGRQVAAETKPALRRMANGEAIKVE